MRFLNGMWLLRQGVELFKAKQSYEITSFGDHLEITVPTTFIDNRRKALDLVTLSLIMYAPCNDVIGLKIKHFDGETRKGPRFQLSKQNAAVTVEETDDQVIFRSGESSAYISKGNAFNISYYYRDKYLTSTGDGLTGIAYILDNGVPHIREMLNLSVGECVYGLGERFTHFAKNGQNVEIWNEDGGTCTDIAYKSVPFYMTDRGYGVFINDPGRVSFEIGTEVVSKVQFSVQAETLEYFIIGGPSLKDVIGNYTSLSGKPALPPAWSFGLWLTTSFTTDYDETTVNSLVEEMERRDIPLHVFHFDCFWMKEMHWCDFTFNNRFFPNPKDMIRRMKDKGLKICVWINPYISQFSQLFEEGRENGYLLKKKNDDIWQWDRWQPGMACVDFTNPAAIRWYQEKLQALIDIGIDCFKTDFGERIPTNVVYYDGSSADKMHNYYSYLYQKTVFDLLERNFGVGQAVLFARAGTAGGQQFPIHWGGDSSSSYESMAETLRGGLSLAMSGYSFWSHDISGFEQTATPDLYKRWCAFGLLSSHSRLHGSSSFRVPWKFDEESCDVLRFFVKLKCQLMPYLFSAACYSHDTGIPMMRPLIMDYQDDPACKHIDTQYMLGNSLLVAPVFREDGVAEFYVPDGIWTNILDGEEFVGNRWYRRQYDYFHLALLAPENSIIPFGHNENQPDYRYIDGITYCIFKPTDTATFTFDLYDTDGICKEKVHVSRYGNILTVRTENAQYSWSARYRDQIISADAGEKEVVINLKIEE